jgi:hypothetical protein
MDTVLPEMQVVFVCRTADFLSSPIAELKGVAVVDLDKEASNG